MTRMIFCTKLRKEAEGLGRPPYPNEIGQRIYDNISQEAWRLWIEHQTRLINEYRLNLLDPKCPSIFNARIRKISIQLTRVVHPPPATFPPKQIRLDDLAQIRFNCCAT